MKIKVSELQPGPQIDALVAEAQNLDGFIVYDGKTPVKFSIYTEPKRERRNDLRGSKEYNPSGNGAQAMELARKYSMIVHFGSFKAWLPDYSGGTQCGETPEIAICRAVIAAHFGDEVEVADD